MGQPVVHFEIGCKDAARTSEFYSKLFDWKIEQSGGPSAMIDTGSKAGIHGHITALGHEPHRYINIYAEVDDVQASVDRAVALGGKTVVPPTDVPGQGKFAWIADPEGTIVGLWKSLEPRA
jgi:hypothetical protein